MKFVKNIDWISRHEKTFVKIRRLQQRRISNEILVKTKDSPVPNKAPTNIFAFKHKVFRRGVKEDFLFSGSFQEGVMPVLILAQIFALMPVKGITMPHADQLSFSWTHLRTIYSFVILLFMGGMALITICCVFKKGIDFDGIETIIFYVSIFLISASFLRLATKWPNLMLKWEATERSLPPFRNQKENSALAYKIKMITFIASMLSLSEHLLSMLSMFYYANNCPARPNVIESYLFSNFNQVFYFIDYNTIYGLFGKFLNVLSTFAWNFTDIFIMIISVGLSSRFRQLNDYLLVNKGKNTTPQFWTVNRQNYRNLCKLCDEVDIAISYITLLCFSNNLYFICGKILKSIQAKPSITHTVYFWFSLIYLLGRTLVLSLYSADINEESKRPLKVLRAIPRESWCLEAKRFWEEVTTDLIALSGMRFFYLTRGLVLAVAGTIVTYELVLLQFIEDKGPNTC